MGGPRNVWFLVVSAVAVAFGVVHLTSGSTESGEWQLGLGLFGLVGCLWFAWVDYRSRRNEDAAQE